MAEKWQNKLYKIVKGDLGKGTDGPPFSYKLPKLSRPQDDDLAKQWVVHYGVWNTDERQVVRKRVVLVGDTVADRLAHAKRVIDFLTDFLGDGKAFIGTKPRKKYGGGRPKGSRNYRDVATNAGTPTEKPSVNPPFSDTVLVSSPQIITSAPSAAGLADLTIVNAYDRYLKYCRSVLEDNSVKRYRSSLNALLAYLEKSPDLDLETCQLGHFKDYHAYDFLQSLTDDGKANRTRNNRMHDLYTFFSHFIKADKRSKSLTINPFQDIDELPCVTEKHQAYSQQEQADYRNACLEMGTRGAELLFFCRFLYYTLTRPDAETRHLRVRDLQKSKIYIPGTVAKEHRGEYVLLPEGLQELIEERNIRKYPGHYYIFSHNNEPGTKLIGPKYMYRRHLDVLSKLEMTDTRHDVYSWKHTGAIALWNATHDIELVRQQCRHQTIMLTIRYLRDLGADMADATAIHKFPKF